MREASRVIMFRGVVYDSKHTPADPAYRLDERALRSLADQLTGVPIRIEHAPAGDVGRVTGVRLDAGVLSVDWALHDNAAGWSSERFIEKGIAPELSLQHALYADGTVRPIEVSLVRRGARDGCSIDADSYKPATVGAAIQQIVMASATENTTPLAAAAAPVAPAASPAAVGEVRPRDETGRFMSTNAGGGGGEPTEEQHGAGKKARFETPMDFVNDISTKITDASTLQTVLDYLAENIDTHVKTQNEVTALRQAKELLEQSQKAHVDASKNVVRDIVDTLSLMYQNFGASTMENGHKEKLSALLAENMDAREALRPILVAASAVNGLRAAAQAASSTAAVESASARIRDLTNQLNAARRLTSAPSAAPPAPTIAPQWTQVAPPVAEIAASAHAPAAPAAHAPPAFTIPDILRGGPSFGEGGVGRVTRDQFSRKM